jgi:hypothetical protein
MAEQHSNGTVVLMCSRCKREQPIENFRRRSGRPPTGKRLGRCSPCIACEKEMAKTPHRREQANRRVLEFKQRLKERDCAELRRREREANLKRKYGFGEAEYGRLLAAHDGVCAICSQPPTKGRGNRLHVDHDHGTGAIRGLLCTTCNTGLGNLNDDIDLLLKAVAYLARHARREESSMTFTTPIS